MKVLSKTLSVLIAMMMLIGMNAYSAEVYAETVGQGTETDPYLIRTAQELQNINNDVSAHYKLAADIDLQSKDFTPIGNADSGAFSGSFDGAGYTISNLTVDSGKYAGLFGCNEGIVKNVTLNKVSIKGTRYVSGIVAYNGENGSIISGTVSSGKVVCDDGISDRNVAGICAYNRGSVSGGFKNKAEITIELHGSAMNDSQYLGGIIGYSNSETNFVGTNEGQVSINNYLTSSNSSIACIGGLIGCANKSISISNSRNTGNIISSRKVTSGYKYNTTYLGGLLGKCNEFVEITQSNNTGDVISEYGEESIVGGIVGKGKLNCSRCYNAGNIRASAGDSYAGGVSGLDAVSIDRCYNSGMIYTSSYSDYFMSSYDAQSGGISCTGGDIVNCYNSGNIYSTGSNSWGRVASGIVCQGGKVDKCYNSGNIYSSGGIYLIGSNSTNSYSSKNIYCFGWAGDFSAVPLLDNKDLRNRTSYLGWDFENIWSIDDTINGGAPFLVDSKNEITLNCVSELIKNGDSKTIIAYKNGSNADEVEWNTTYGNAIVNNEGAVSLVGTGFSTISVTDNEGNRENFNVHGIVTDNSIELPDFSINIGKSLSKEVVFEQGTTGDCLINVRSDNENIEINNFVGNKIYLKANSLGKSIISFETVSGAKGSCTVTVTNTVEKIDITSSSATVPRGTSKQLNLTTTPTPTSSIVTWSSSDESIATVDENGVVTGIATGTVTVKAQADNGLYATCSVTVNAPVLSLQFEKNEMAIYKGDTEQLNLVKDPADTSDSISYSSSYSSVATVSSSGLITAKAAGTTTITATASSGIKTTCKVKVLDYPTIVTGVTLDKTEYDLKTGEMFQLKATVTPNNATNPAITWASTDETVATVNKDGRVTAVGAGKSLITAESENGIIAYCTVNVTGVASTNISKIYVPQILATDEEYVDVPVMIENNPGINFASIKILYDSSNMEAQSVTNGTVFDSVMGSIEDSCVKLYFTSSGDKSGDGVLAMIRFKVQRVQQEQSYLLEVCYYPGEIRNENSSSVTFNLSDGKLGVPACSHKSTEIEGVLESTCTSNGYTGDEVCINCNYVVKTGEVVSMKQHSWEFVTDREATYGTVGQKSLHCSVCGTRQEGSEIEIPKLICSLSAPKTVTAQLYGYDDIIVSWSKVEGASGYAVYYKNSSETKYSLIRTVSTSIKCANLSDGVKYTIKVTPYIKENGKYYNSNSNRITSLYTLKKLTTPKVAKVSASYVKVSWKNISGESGYQIARSKYSNKNYSIVKTVSYKYSSAKIKTVKKKTYYYKVRAYKTVNGKKIYGPWSSVKKYKLR